jgi:hypothetical protein
MSKVITFSRFFPSYHPRKGEPTYFIEKIQTGLLTMGLMSHFTLDSIPIEILETLTKDLVHPKYHTIRAGNRFKVGDMFSPRIWSGRPYNSKQIVIAPDLKVEKVWDFEVAIRGKVKTFKTPQFTCEPDIKNWFQFVKNDGFDTFYDMDSDDFNAWFNKPFKGQIICWNRNITY